MKPNKRYLEDVVIEEKSSENIDFTGNLIESIYYNSLPTVRNKPWKNIKDGKVFSLNSYGFRSPDFSKDVEYLFSGCSVTHGWGLDVEDLWQEKLANKLGVSYSTVATPGDSIPAQVIKIFSYIKEYGNPKNIVALMPDFNRFLCFNNQKLMATQTFFNSFDADTYIWAKNGGNDERTKEYLQHMYKNTAPIDPNQSTKDYFKRPLVADQAITQEISHMYASHYLHMLSQYCKASGINFVWGTWDMDTERLMQKIKKDNYFDEYLSLEADEWSFLGDFEIDLYKKSNCHDEYNVSDTFHLASDRSLGREHAHYGSHRHIHYYEKFLNHIQGGWK